MADQNTIDRLTSVPGLRADVAQRVAQAYPDPAALSEATQDDLTGITGVGAVTAARIVEEFAGTADVRPTAGSPAAGLEPVRREAEQAENPLDTIKVAAKAVTTGVLVVAGTVGQQLPEIKHHVGRAAGAVVELGRELGRTVLRRT